MTDPKDIVRKQLEAAQMLPKVFVNFQAQGKRVKRALPPAGIKDVADVMQG